MKKLLLFLLLALPAFGQTFAGRAGSDIFVTPPFRFCLGGDDGQSNCVLQTGFQLARFSGQLDFQWAGKTVLQLGSPAASLGRTFRVTDGLNNVDCSTGGGTASVLCTSNGFSWTAMGAGSISCTDLGSGNITCNVITSNTLNLTGTGAGIVDFTCGTGPGNPSAGKARLYCDSGTQLMTCLLSNGTGCFSSGSFTPPGSNQQVLFNDSGAAGGANGLLWDKSGLTFTIAANAAATSGANVNSPPLRLQSNWFNATSSATDYWQLQDVVLPINSANARSSLIFSHVGTTGNANGSNFNIVFNPDGTRTICDHDDPAFSTNSVACWLLAAANTAGTGGEFEIWNTATSGSARSRLLIGSDSSSAPQAHVIASDPNNTNSREFGMASYPADTSTGSAYKWLLVTGVTGNVPKLYLGGNAWAAGTSAALECDVQPLGNNCKWFGAFAADAGATFDASAMTATNAFKVKVGAGAAPTANGAIAYDSTANNWVVGKNGSTFTMCTTAGESGCGSGGGTTITTSVLTSDYNSADASADPIGLTLTLPASTAATYYIDCNGSYSQATAATSQTIGFQNVTTTATYIWGSATVGTTTSAVKVAGAVPPLDNSNHALITFSPSLATDLPWELHFTVVQPSGLASNFQIMWTSATGGTDVTTVFRGARCQMHT